MIKFNTIGAIEHLYAFEDAVVDTTVFNGDFGTVTNGKFAPAAAANKAIMQIEEGDDAGMPEYKITAGSRVRVLDLAKLNGKTIEVYGAQLPSTFIKGDKLVSDVTGKLVVTNGTQEAPTAAPYLEVTKIIGNKLGIEATVITE